MHLSKDEARAVAFVLGLVALAAAARLVGRPAPVRLEAGTEVDVAALERSSQALLAEEQARERPLAVVTLGRDDDLRVLLATADRVRATGVVDAEVYPAPVKHAAQMRYADSRGARFVLTLDRDATVSVKDLRTGERSSAAQDEVAELLAKSVLAERP